jgi:hypothetical protein
MKIRFNIFLIITLGLFISCSEDTVNLVGVGTISGRVVEANNFTPIENAKVTLTPSNNAVFSDAEGYFTFPDAQVGDYSVSATKEGFLTGYEAASIIVGLEVNVIFEMEVETALNRPPTTPELITPVDGSEDQELELELVWQSTDPERDDLMYRLEIKNDYDNDIYKVESIIDTTFVVSNLKYGRKYFWQIIVSDAINPEVLSAVNTFKTKVNPENRFFYVKKETNSNNVIYSANYNDSDNLSENEVQLTKENQNSWRPRKNQASNLIAFLRTANNETHLFTMWQDGSNVKQVTSTVPIAGINLNEIDFAWSSNGDRLLYPYYNKLYVINKDGSGLKQIYETLDGSYITECDWSNDESLIAIKTNDITGYDSSIKTIDMSGNVIDIVVANSIGAIGGLNFSIDNKLLLYTYDISDYQNSNYRQLDSHVFLYNLIKSTTTDLSSGKIAGSNDFDVRFSPNEAKVIFVNASNDGVSIPSIYSMDVNDGNARTLLFSNATMPDWE